MKDTSLAVFEGKQIRRYYVENTERMQDMADPARSLDRAREYWQQHGRSEKWIQQRVPQTTKQGA